MSRFFKQQIGFTIIEILVVLSIIALLLTLALPKYFRSIDHAKESVLIQNLATTREAIDRFYNDKGKYPDSLNDLIEKQYLKTTPIDPVSEQSFTIVPPNNGIDGRVYNIKSTAIGNSSNGTPFANL